MLKKTWSNPQYSVDQQYSLLQVLLKDKTIKILSIFSTTKIDCTKPPFSFMKVMYSY